MQRIPVAEPIDAPDDARRERTSSFPDGALTHATLHGCLLGTPAYMSPEQASGRSIDHRADVWALAVIAYHLLTGEFPFDGATPEQLMLRLCRVRPISITVHRSDLPPAIVDLFGRAFARHINDRFLSAVAFAGALEHVSSFEQRTAGAAPKPMSAISLPPTGEIERVPTDPPRPPSVRPGPQPLVRIESSIVAAGVPRKRRLWPRLVAGAAVLVTLFATASTLSVYFEHETAKATGLTTSATESDLRKSQAISERDEIPPPDPAAATPSIEAADLPAASTAAVSAPMAARPSPQSVTTTAHLPAEPAPAAMSPTTPAVQQPPSKQVDRSEVF
jgi:serine/threonine-protein kinase